MPMRLLVLACVFLTGCIRPIPTPGPVPEPTSSGIRVLLDWDGHKGFNFNRFKGDAPSFKAELIAPSLKGKDKQIQDAVLSRVKAKFLQWNFRFYSTHLNQRPGTPFTRIVIGGKATGLLGAKADIKYGLAPLDIGNKNPSDVGIVFAESLQGMGTLTNNIENVINVLANTVAHEFGHTVGLRHAEDPTDVMSIKSGWSLLITDLRFQKSKLADGTWQDAPQILQKLAESK